jgi:hypothetical protein
MGTTGWSIPIVCSLALVVSACNQHQPLLDLPVSPTIPVPSPIVASVTLSPGAVKAGASLQGTVLLNGPAPASGMDVSLTASDDAAIVDPVVRFPAGFASVDFSISTRVVPNDRHVVITASAANRSASSSFAVWAETAVFFAWFSEPGDFIGRGRVDRFTPATATFSGFCDRNVVDVRMQLPGPSFWSASFSGPAGVALRPGAYEGATRHGFNRATPGLAVSGESRGCNSVGGRFVIHDIDLQNNRINRFHASFVQRCDNSAGLLSGEIRVANLPPSTSVVSCQR